jgi:ubiquinone/menaquinone biosynthesis C-methylase UbiE
MNAECMIVDIKSGPFMDLSFFWVFIYISCDKYLCKGEKTAMNNPVSAFHFKFMSFGFKFRDFFLPPKNILKEVGIKHGFHVLDYGCGPGNYIVPLAELVGKSGKIYALDIHPLAIRSVQSIASKRQLTNVETICSDCKTGLQDNSVDVALLYDTFHTLSDPDGVLKELHRVLKRNGILSFSSGDHMTEKEIISEVTNGGLFRLTRKGKRTLSFLKGEQPWATLHNSS